MFDYKKIRNISFLSLLILLCWLVYFSYFNLWYLFKSHYLISLTMVVGSFIAGATSEGGGAIAFPVMTLALSVAPSIARDFSLLIQSFGMTAASATIVKSRISVSKMTILFSSLGACVGNFIAFSFLENLFSPPALKLAFCSFWMTFALFILRNKILKKEERETTIEHNLLNAFILFCTGILGGCLSALFGSGLDIMTFSVLILYFNQCEKVATPTSVILMAINSIVAVLIKVFFFSGVSPLAVKYLLVCIPIVIIGAPCGSLFINEKRREFIIKFLMTTITIQFVSALFIIPLTKQLITITLITFVIASLFFSIMIRVSHRRKSSM